jgi:hypothetical protein
VPLDSHDGGDGSDDEQVVGIGEEPTPETMNVRWWNLLRGASSRRSVTDLLVLGSVASPVAAQLLVIAPHSDGERWNQNVLKVNV